MRSIRRDFPRLPSAQMASSDRRNTPAPTVRVTGDAVTLDELALTTKTLAHVADDLQRLIDTDSAELVVTLNVDQLLSLRRETRLIEAYDEAAMRLIDGMPIVWLARLLGARHVHRHTGADLLPHCAGLAEERGWRIVVTGGPDEVGRQAVDRLRDCHSGADIHHVPFPLLRTVDDPAAHEVVDKLQQLAPDIVFLCLGSPKQESWFLTWRPQLPHGVYVGAGAAVDFAAGVKIRAPRWIQSSGLEWFWRLAQEPQRMAHRYLVRGPEFVHVIVRSLKQRKA